MEYISPGSWFYICLPDGWHEFEDSEDCFLFYNPECWNGNFRISAYKGERNDYARRCMADEIRQTQGSKQTRIGTWDCVTFRVDFQEEGTDYTTYFWVTGAQDVLVECSLTVKEGESPQLGEDIVKTLRLRRPGETWKQVINVRLPEISRINSGYEWASKEVKKQLRKDFTSSQEDIEKLQTLVDKLAAMPKDRAALSDIGIAFGVILVEEMDGLHWVSVIDGANEYPALRFEDTDVFFYPTDFLYETKKAGKPCLLRQVFENLKARIEKTLQTK